MSYRLDYYPSSDAGSYPSRKTLRETYKQITDDLDSAAVYINATGEQSSFYVTTDAVTALQARVALAMDSYALAAQKAVEVINTNTYMLVNTPEMMEDFWWNDFDTESLFKLAVTSSSDRAGQTGQVYLPYNETSVPDYVPTQDVVDLYADNDIRKGVFFLETTVNSNAGTSGVVYALNKFTDNGFLYTQNGNDEYSRFMVEPKVLRISEMYLIAAEAYAMQGNVSEGAKWLNAMERERITGYEDKTFATSDVLMTEIRNERQREFIGEGVRLFDLEALGHGRDPRHSAAGRPLQPAGFKHLDSPDKAGRS